MYICNRVPCVSSTVSDVHHAVRADPARLILVQHDRSGGCPRHVDTFLYSSTDACFPSLAPRGTFTRQGPVMCDWQADSSARDSTGGMIEGLRMMQLQR